MNWHGAGGACPSYWPYGARGKQWPGDQFLRAGRGAAGEYSFRNAATQAELAECARPAVVAPSGRRDGYLCIDGGKKAKMRPGDILGALTGDIGLDGADIGKINVHPMHVYVAVRQAVAQKPGSSCKTGRSKASHAGYGY